MMISHIKFIDNLNYIPMCLADLPKSFSFELRDTLSKDFFPHLLNTLQN